MTFMKGTTTWALLPEKLIQLATGAVADDFGVTASAGDKWRRMNASQPVVAPPASQDTAVSQEHRTGYWLRVDDTCLYQDRVAGAGTYCRQTGILAAWPAAMKQTVLATLRVNTSNTVAGNYSTAVIVLRPQSVDTVGWGVLDPQNVTLNAAGVGTVTLTTGATMTLQFGDPTGILALNATFSRTFTSAYRGGIDTWRGYGKSTTAPTYSVAPPGVLDTDYAAVLLSGDNSLWTANSSYWQTPLFNNSQISPVGHSQGLGIKTNAALTGDRYVVGFSKNEAMGAIHYNGATAATSQRICYSYGGYAVNADASVMLGVGGSNQFYAAINATKGPTFLNPFTANPSSTAAKVEYWISVTPEHLSIALNGEVGFGGQDTQNMVAKVVMADPVADEQVWFLGLITPDGNTQPAWQERHWIRLGAHGITYKISQKGLRDGGRDWQTGQGRYDFLFKGEAMAFGYFGEMMAPVQSFYLPSEAMGNSAASYFGAIPASTNRVTVLQYADPRWLMASTPLLDYGTSTNAESSSPGIVRACGYVDHGLLMVSLSGFAAGDELTDTVTGKKYMLFLGSNRSGVGGGAFGIAMEEV